MREDTREDVEALIAPELGEGEQVCVTVPRTGATGLFLGPGSDAAIVATTERVFFIERFMTGSMKVLQEHPIDEIRLDDGLLGRMTFVLLSHLRLELPDGPATVGDARCRREMKTLRSIIVSTNA